jgi:pyruvate dehydrogenase E1 component alpha subunit
VSRLPTREQGLALLREMLRIRRFEEKCAELYSAGSIRGFLHLYIGEEATAVGLLGALDGDDNVISTYREHGHALARGIPMNAVMAEMFGKIEGTSRGRGGSMHLFSTAHRFFGGHAIVAGGLPVAVGMALADSLQDTRRVTVCIFGDGAVAEGEFHESMNLAALWRLPVLFVCENNLYAMGTHVTRAHAETDMTRKADAYRMPSGSVDGMDVLAVSEAARAAVSAIREATGPRFLECRTYRYRAHSMYDPELYRSKEEVGEWKRRDPIPALEARLKEADLLRDEDRAALELEVKREIEAAVEFAGSGRLEGLEDLLRYVYAGEEP